MQDRVRILFLCTGNSCRSQMAEGWARALKPDELNVQSAGIIAKGIDPRAAFVMAEAGIDISSQSSKTVEDVMDMAFDYVITLCGHAFETCPLFPGSTQVLHHGFDDPPKLAENAPSDEAALTHYRRVRDEIRDFIMALPNSLKDIGNGGLFISH